MTLVRASPRGYPRVESGYAGRRVTDSLLLLAIAGAVLLGFVMMVFAVGAVMVRTVGRMRRYGGVTGALHEGRVGRTYGELDAAPRGIANVRIRVVGVEREVPAVGLEVHTNARVGYAIRAVRLTPEEALRVADALEALARS